MNGRTVPQVVLLLLAAIAQLCGCAGDDQNLWSRRYTGGWSAWQAAIAGPAASAPSAVSWAAGRIDVFVSRADNRIYHAFGLTGDPYARGATGYRKTPPSCR